MSENNAVNASILLVGTASGIFAGFCPSWFTVASPFFHAQEARKGNIQRIRWGEVAASAIVLTMGMVVSRSQRSSLPMMAALGICAVFIGGYEYMIAHPATDER